MLAIPLVDMLLMALPIAIIIVVTVSLMLVQLLEGAGDLVCGCESGLE